MLIDYYKILNVPFGASDTEIKKSFRKLATIHHPDKNGGSKKSEETFKVIINAYEVLSDKEKRAIYDIKYEQHFREPRSEPKFKSQKFTSEDTSKTYSSSDRKYPNTRKGKDRLKYSIWVIMALIAILYMFRPHGKTSTGNLKADKQLEEQKAQNRPQSGELDFND